MSDEELLKDTRLEHYSVGVSHTGAVEGRVVITRNFSSLPEAYEWVYAIDDRRKNEGQSRSTPEPIDMTQGDVNS